MFDSWFQRHAQKFVLQALSQLKHGQLRVITQHDAKDIPVSVFGDCRRNVKQDNEHITVVVKNPNAWTRLAQAFDLVMFTTLPSVGRPDIV
jgi:hypothetical protein